jgi:hypothetical protein
MVGFCFWEYARSREFHMETVKETASKRIGTGLAGPGRPKGSVNKVGRAARDVIAEAAERLGGVDRVVAWAQESGDNEKAFWTQLYPKLVPLENYVSGPDGGPVTLANINVLPVSARVGSDG